MQERDPCAQQAQASTRLCGNLHSVSKTLQRDYHHSGCRLLIPPCARGQPENKSAMLIQHESSRKRRRATSDAQQNACERYQERCQPHWVPRCLTPFSAGQQQKTKAAPTQGQGAQAQERAARSSLSRIEHHPAAAAGRGRGTSGLFLSHLTVSLQANKEQKERLEHKEKQLVDASAELHSTQEQLQAETEVQPAHSSTAYIVSPSFPHHMHAHNIGS